jgi:hypothetical protein
MYKIQQAFGDKAMGTTQIKEWYNCFKDGHSSVKSETHSAKPSTSTNEVFTDHVRILVVQDHQITIRNMQMR